MQIVALAYNLVGALKRLALPVAVGPPVRALLDDQDAALPTPAHRGALGAARAPLGAQAQSLGRAHRAVAARARATAAARLDGSTARLSSPKSELAEVCPA